MDTHCARCGEPWDIYGLSHGDVAAWEADCIRKGLGCPCCNGKESDEYYAEPEYIQLGQCADCSNGYSLHADEVHYDGKDKVFHHGDGTLKIDDKEAIENFLKLYHEWEYNSDGLLVCERCASNYNQCDNCSKIFPADEMFYIQDYQELYCQDCYCEIFSNCCKCDCNLKIEDLKMFNDECYCEYCYSSNVDTCEICEKLFLKEEMIIGVHEETCCSEKCADETSDL